MIEFVQMAAEHISEVSEIEKLCFGDPWSIRSIESELNNRLSYWLVAVDRGRVIGYIGSQSVIDEADIMNVAVHPEHRRMGVGRELVIRLCDHLRAHGISGVLLEVRVSNTPAISLYENLGFLQVGLRRNYYRNPKEDAKIMRKELQK